MTQKILTASSVAGNVETDFIAPAGNKYKLLYGHANLTTDATVANRLFEIGVYDSNDAFVFDVHAGIYVTASQSPAMHFELMQGIYRETSDFANTIQVPIPGDFIILPGWYYKVSIGAGVAGDTYNVNLVVEELHEGARA